MNVVIQSCLSNTAIIFLMHLFIDILLNQQDRLSPRWTSIFMVLIVSLAVITMFYLPIQYGEYRFDLRLIPLVFLAAIWGWKLAVPALLLTTVWRFFLGGDGSIPGIIFGMVLPVLITLIVTSKWKLNSIPRLILLFTISWLISDTPIILMITDGWSIFKEIFVVRYISFLLTACILYLFILNQEREIRLKQKLKYYAEHDALTGLYNIRYFIEQVKTNASDRQKKYIVMVDIDHFKFINDTFGHPCGDQILKKVASVVSDNNGENSLVDLIAGRYGGEEFILYVGAETKIDMVRTVEDIHLQLRNFQFKINEHSEYRLTVSIGVAELTDLSDLYPAIERADQALYRSKRNGRNQINYDDNVN